MSETCINIGFICLLAKIDIGDVVLTVIALVGLLSIFFAYQQVRLSKNAQKTRISIDLHADFYSDRELREFFYRLDYSSGDRAWKFDPERFAHSEEEHAVDLILYKLSFIGHLTRNRELTARDLLWLKDDVAIILENSEVQKYLEWLQRSDQIPGHASFSGAAHLYNLLFGESGSAHVVMKSYLDNAAK